MSRLQRSSMPVPPAAPLVPLAVRRMNMVSSLLTTVFVLLAISGAVLWLMRLPLFNLSVIRIGGDVSRNSASTLRANVMSHLAGNFFTLDMAQTRAAFEAVPWVRKAAVRREFPSSLKVVLQEHKAVARWGVEGDPYLVNTFGEVFEVNQGDLDTRDAQELPLLTGPTGKAGVLLQAYQVLSPVFEQLDAVLETLELTPQGSWRAELDSGAVINMGHGAMDEIVPRTRRFIDTLTQVSSRYGRALESADLRYSTGYAIKLRGVTTVTAAELKDKKVKR